MVKKQGLESFCGNCQFHSVYRYPDTVFCFKRFQLGKEAVFSTLHRCELWELQSQECFCLKDALEKQKLEKG